MTSAVPATALLSMHIRIECSPSCCLAIMVDQVACAWFWDKWQELLGLTLQVKGLRKRKNGRWETQIMHKGKRHYLGTYDTAEEALEARNRRARELSITGATLPSKTPGSHRSKRGTAQPGLGGSAHVPVAAVPPSVHHGSTQRTRNVVCAAPSHAVPPLQAQDVASIGQPVLHAGDLTLTKKPRPASPCPRIGACAPHSASTLPSASAPRAMYPESPHVSSIDEAQHDRQLHSAKPPYVSVTCTEDLDLSVATGTSALTQPPKQEAALLHAQRLGCISTATDTALERSSELHPGIDAQHESSHCVSGSNGQEMASSGSMCKVCSTSPANGIAMMH